MTWEFKTLRERILDWCCSFWGFYVGLCPHSSTVSVLGVASWQYLTLTRNVRSDCKLVQPTLYQNRTLIDTKLEIIVL